MEVDDSTIFDENARCFINDLPDEVIEYILSLLPPYKDLEQCMLVCKRWQKNVLSKLNVFLFGLRLFLLCTLLGPMFSLDYCLSIHIEFEIFVIMN